MTRQHMIRRSDPPHLVVVGTGERGQAAIDTLAHRVSVQGGRLTVVVPRRDQDAFANRAPRHPEWSAASSVKEHLEQLASGGRSVGYLYDDHIDHLAADLIHGRSTGRPAVAYISGSAGNHYPFVRYLSRFCDTVLVEKPVSTLWRDIRPDGRFAMLAEQSRRLPNAPSLLVAEELMFRPGVIKAQLPQHGEEDPLQRFLTHHAHCDLQYDFQMYESASRDDGSSHIARYQSGLLLDTLVPHGLGLLVCLVLRRILDATPTTDLASLLEQNVRLRHLQSRVGAAPDGLLRFPTLSETAADIGYEIELPGVPGGPQSRTLAVRLRGAKGQPRYGRHVHVSCEACRARYTGAPAAGPDTRTTRLREKPFFAISLGDEGHTVHDPGRHSHLDYVEHARGYLADAAPGTASGWHRAHAMMLDDLATHSRPGAPFENDGSYLAIDTACAIARIAHDAHGRAMLSPRRPYLWGSELEFEEHPPHRVFEGKVGSQGPVPNATGEPAAGGGDPVARQVVAAMGLSMVRPPPERLVHRLVTVLGPEGSGKTEACKAVHDALEREHPAVRVIEVSVPQFVEWSREKPDFRKYMLDDLCRRLARSADIMLASGRPPAQALVEFFSCMRDQRGNPAPDSGSTSMPPLPAMVLLLNGVGRIPEDLWHSFVEILRHVPLSVRIVLFSTSDERACGLTLSTEEFTLQGQWVENNLDALWRVDARMHRRELDPREEKLLVGKNALNWRPSGSEQTYWEMLKTRMRAYAGSNPAVARLLGYCLYYLHLEDVVARLEALESPREWNRHPPDLERRGRRVRLLLEDELACLVRPRPHVDCPELVLDRVAIHLLSKLSHEDRCAIRLLATLPEPFTPGVLETAKPGLSRDVEGVGAIRAAFESTTSAGANRLVRLVPEVRRAALRYDQADAERLSFEIGQRRIILWNCRTLSQEFGPVEHSAVAERVVGPLLRLDLGEVDLGGGSFAMALRELFRPLHTASAPVGNHGFLRGPATSTRS